MHTAGTVLLFIGVSPRDTDHLRVDEESRAIELALAQSPFRSDFHLEKHFAVRIDDLPRLLLQHRPQIVHFAGHGAPDSELILEDANGDAVSVPAEALSRLFALFESTLRCVVLSACFSEAQAEGIAAHVPCVIGMSQEVTDAASVKFAAAFYQSLAHGASVQMAFEVACVQVDLFGLAEGQTPRLMTRTPSDRDLVFAGAASVPPADAAAPSDDAAAPPAVFTTHVSGGQVGQVINIEKLDGGLRIGGA